MDISHLRFLLLSVSFFLCLIFGCLPILILRISSKVAATASVVRVKQLSLFICLSSCFSGGVLLTTCLLNMIPEIQHHYKNIIEHCFWSSKYPISELCICLGFFLVCFIEELFALMAKPKVIPIKRTDSTKRKSVTFAEKLHEIQIPMLPADPEANNAGKSDKPKPILVERRSTASMFPAKRSRRGIHSHWVRSSILLASLTLHSFVEGLTYGLRQGRQMLVRFFLVTSVHQCFVAFALGFHLYRTHRRHTASVILIIALHGLATPCGALLGVALQQSVDEFQSFKETSLLLLESFASGAFLYVVFYEIILNQRNNEHGNLYKLAAVFMGFVVVASTTLIYSSKSKGGNEFHELHQH